MWHYVSKPSDKKMGTPPRTSSTPPVSKDNARCIDDCPRLTSKSIKSDVIPLSSLLRRDKGKRTDTGKIKRTIHSMDEESLYWERINEENISPILSSTSTACMSFSWNSIKSARRSDCNSSTCTPPRKDKLFFPSMHDCGQELNYSPLSYDGVTLMNSSLSSADSESIPGLECKSFQPPITRNINIHDRVEDMNFLHESSAYRRKPMETVETYHARSSSRPERKYHCSSHSLVNPMQTSDVRFMKQSKFTSLVRKMLLLIFVYSVAMSMLFSKFINAADFNSKFYEELKSQYSRETRAMSRPRSVSIPQHDSPFSEQLFIDGALTIRRSLGGFHTFHDIHENERGSSGKAYSSKGFLHVDNGMYHHRTSSSTEGTRPRIYHFGLEDGMVRRRTRRLDLPQTTFSDNTQLYGILSSDDPALSRMEPSLSEDNDGCDPEPWQNEYYPSCNSMHELDILRVDDMNGGAKTKLFKKQGYWRNAWQVDLPSFSERTPIESCILKTPK